MPSFNVSVVTRIEIAGQIEVNAKDEEAANNKVQAMIDKGKFAVTWSPSTTADESIEMEEADCTSEIDSCEEL